MTAPEFDAYISYLNDRNLNPVGYNKKIKTKINKLYSLLDKIKPLGDDDYKVLYFCLEKGDIEKYGDYEELKSLEFVSSYDEFTRMFDEDYPDELKWYKLSTVEYKSFRSVFINSKNIIYADMEKDGISFEDECILMLLESLINTVNTCLKKLEKGTYNDYISKNYSYKNRFGVVKRIDYFKIYPEAKNNLLSEISTEEMNYFINNAGDIKNERIKTMTSGKYFECVKIAYESIGYETENLSGKKLYIKHADGRDEGLTKLDENSPEEFDNWYNDKTKFGGHPWEIVVGHTFARINLFVAHDEKGYYLSISGSTILRKIEIAKIFNALNKKKVPIEIFNSEIIKNAFKEKDYIGIVPHEIFPVMCEGYFTKYKPLEFTHVDDDKNLKVIKWEPLEKIELK